MITPISAAALLGPDDLRISFDVAPDTTSTYYYADHIIVDPDWLTRPEAHGSSKHSALMPPAEDIALVFLSQDVAAVSPAPVAGPGYLDNLDLTSETFTAVGYGIDDFVTGSAASSKPTFIVDGVRSFRDVSVITDHDVFPDRFLKTTQGVCFGDSGGPLFHKGTLVALNTWTFSQRCSGPNLQYRVDATAAQQFLDTYL